MQQTKQAIISPYELKCLFPLSSAEQQAVNCSRLIISNIIHGRDPRMLVVCGPCSINDVDAAIDYARRLQALSLEVKDQLYIIMRVYFEKPRTTTGWKGLINDPYMDGSCDIEAGLKIARSLLLDLIKMGLPVAIEALDLNSQYYLADLVSWSAIGARTTESQTHREIASGLSMPVGFKNGTDGNLTTAINAILAAKISHRFLGINQDGKICILQTSGNQDGHIILRGGKLPNYYPHNIADCEIKLEEAGLPLALMIDCSHGNSNKDYRRQADVVQSVLMQIKAGNRSIIGIMLESYINAGNQPIELPFNKMRYGVSVTDACIDWNSTYRLLHELHGELQNRLHVGDVA